MEKIKFTDEYSKLSAGYSCVDSLMNGGIEAGIITEVYGEGGSGKTNMSMVFSCASIKSGHPVIYIDTEGFSIERFRQICGNDENIYNHMNIYRVKSLDDQHLALIKSEKLIAEKNESKKSIGLLVVDSFTNFFRMEAGTNPAARMEGYEKQLNILSGIALKFNIPVLITNQIYANVESNILEPFGGFFIDHAMKAIYRIDRDQNGVRKLLVIKHRSIGENIYTRFMIVNDGIECR